jgi:hypothetical protein
MFQPYLFEPHNLLRIFLLVAKVKIKECSCYSFGLTKIYYPADYHYFFVDYNNQKSVVRIISSIKCSNILLPRPATEKFSAHYKSKYQLIVTFSSLFKSSVPLSLYLFFVFHFFSLVDSSMNCNVVLRFLGHASYMTLVIFAYSCSLG